MSRKWQTCVLCSASIALLCFVTSVILVSRASTKSSPPLSENQTQTRSPKRLRNLRLQPEAAAMNRRLGNRFRSESASSVLAGNLTVGSNQQPITIVRKQTDSGETVELFLTDRNFSWSEAEGVRETKDSATEAERLLVERLVFDSPDQFVLAQLRGAGYQTIVRNLRPVDAGDDYAGPLWTMVRVDDLPQNRQVVRSNCALLLAKVVRLQRTLTHLFGVLGAIKGEAPTKTATATNLGTSYTSDAAQQADIARIESEIADTSVLLGRYQIDLARCQALQGG